MFRRDYLVKMIEDMTAMVAKVLALKQERKTTEALWEVDEQYNRHFGLHSRLIHALSAGDLIEMFRLGGGTEADKLQAVARLLREEADIYDAHEGGRGNEEEAVPRRIKALHLYVYADLHGADRNLLDIGNEINALLEQTGAYVLPPETERLLMAWMEAEGRYDKAEDSLYRLLESGEQVEEEGAVFYGRLILKDPAELEEGGLPMEEVRQGQHEWVKRFARPDFE